MELIAPTTSVPITEVMTITFLRALAPATLWQGAAGACVAAVAIGLGVVSATVMGGLLAAVSVLALIAWLVMWRPPSGRAIPEEFVWTRFRQGTLFISFAFVLELSAHAAMTHGALPRVWTGAGFALGVGIAWSALYRGLVRWNRVKTVVSDPSDWLNGISGVMALMALSNFVVAHIPSALAELPWWILQAWFLQFSALGVLAGTMGSVFSLGRLGRDPRGLTVIAALALGFTAQAVGMVAGPLDSVQVGSRALPALAVLTAFAWALLAAALAVASHLRRPQSQPAQEATAQATTAGAIMVLMSSVVVLALDGLFGDTAAAIIPALAATAAGISAIRILRQVRDLSEVARTRAEARTDVLTGLANRRRLVEYVTEAIRRSVPISVMVIDLDRFKELNDRYGHAFGDEVLRALARRLQATVSDRGTLARPGGDEFALLMSAQQVEAAVAVAHDLLATIREPIEIDGRFARLDASIGIAGTELSGRAATDAYRCADAAMYVAKRAGGGVSVYDAAADSRDRATQKLAEELRRVLTEDVPADGRGIVVEYQPQLEVTTGRVEGIEALVRWQHSTLGLLPPAAFLHLAEERGLMGLLTRRVMDLAAPEAARWRSQGHEARLSVNLSASSLMDPALPPTLDEVLAASGLSADALVVEITETGLMQDPDMAVGIARQIAARGIGISIDDYGTGYSSLAYLNRLPARELKLDRTFTIGLTSDPRTAAIVSGTVQLAHHLGLRLVAEGVENEETLDALAALGCDVTQGYLHTRPLPPAQMHRWLRDHDPAPR